MEQAGKIVRVVMIGAERREVLEAAEIARGRGADVKIEGTVGNALEGLRRGNGADVVLADVDLDIAKVIGSLQSERFSLPVIAFGIETQPAKAAGAIKMGAHEFLPLPPDPELIAAILESLSVDERDLVFSDPAMVRVVELARKYARAQANVLITGESGTGKEMMARFVHRNSSRSKGRFVSLNCAAIPENLLESELFGHEKGAFSGAIARRVGKFEEADGGTLFLDEISEMDVRLQAKLLRAIQEREIDRLGGTQPVKIDIRIIATSNRNLQEAVEQGTFREDLLFRLNVLAIELPALRERPNDIETLASYFAKKLSAANGMPFKLPSPATFELLKRMHWRGNVRELENCIHRALLIAEGDVIEPDSIVMPHAQADSGETQVVDLQASSERPTSSNVGKTVAEVERELILETLDQTSGNRTHAANILGISIRTLRNKLKQYAMEGHIPTRHELSMAP
jgi:DNA-binding NtrC family response regulator